MRNIYLFRGNSDMKKILTRFFYWINDIKKKNDFSRLKGIDMKNIDGDPLRYQELRKTLLLLPDNVLKRLRERKVRIVYNTDSNPVSGGKYAGYFRVDSNFIYIWDSGDKLEWQKMTLLHEVGHFIDYDVVSGDSWFSCINKDFHHAAYNERIYYNKKYGESGDYYRQNIKELFAQGFAEYFSRTSSEFEKECPQMRAMIHDLLK